MDIRRAHDPGSVERLLRGLPEWFGIESAIASYVEDAARMPSYLAAIGKDVVGAALVPRWNPRAAELFLIAVERRRHRSGVGTALMTAIEQDLRADGVRWWQVKTVGPSFGDPHYARTLRFYERKGFEPLEEMRFASWPAGPMLVSVKRLD